MSPRGRGESGSARVSDFTARLNLRRRKSRLGTILLALICFLVVAVVGAATWLVGFSSVFAVQTVEVSGTSITTPEVVRNTAAIAVGTPVAAVDVAQVAARVKGLAPVQDVVVRRHWPNTIDIVVTERTASLAVKQNHAATFLLVDASGVAFEETATAPKGLLVATAESADLLDDLAAVVAELGPVRSEVTGLTAKTRDSITVTLKGNRTVNWGSAERSRYKATVLAALLPQKGTVYDVSAPDRPAIR